MVFKFVLEIIIFISLGGVLYLLVRALPRVDDQVFNQPTEIKTHWFSIYLEKIDRWLKALLERWLRRLRVIILKFDNTVSRKLNTFKKEEPKTNGLVDVKNSDRDKDSYST